MIFKLTEKIYYVTGIVEFKKGMINKLLLKITSIKFELLVDNFSTLFRNVVLHDFWTIVLSIQHTQVYNLIKIQKQNIIFAYKLKVLVEAHNKILTYEKFLGILEKMRVF